MEKTTASQAPFARAWTAPAAVADKSGSRNRSPDGVRPAVTLAGSPTELATVFRGLPARQEDAAELAATYYDTEDRRLWRRGFALSLHDDADGRTLTLHREGDDTLTRVAWSAATQEPIPDLRQLPASAPRGEIGAIVAEEFRPLFTSSVTRVRKRLALNDAELDVAFDIGRIAGNRQESPLAALSFTLLEGTATALLDQVKRLLPQHHLRIEASSRAARGMALIDQAPPAPVKAARPSLTAGDTVDDAMTKVIAITVRQIIGNLAAAEDGRDPEGVHQLRVGLRRLRSAIALFGPYLEAPATTLDARTRNALKSLGLARDLDVFVTETLPPLLDGEVQDPALQHLLRRAQARRRIAYTEVQRLVTAPAFNALLLDLMLIAGEGGLVRRDRNALLRPVAVALLHKRHRKALKCGRNFARLGTEQRHEVRIALKKLRYACDYFQLLFPRKATNANLRRMADLQDDLGRLNDATVAEVVVDELTAGDPAAAIGGALVKGWYRHRLVTVEPHMLAAWDGFAQARPFWR